MRSRSWFDSFEVPNARSQVVEFFNELFTGGCIRFHKKLLLAVWRHGRLMLRRKRRVAERDS
jgi:hypothetical protein